MKSLGLTRYTLAMSAAPALLELRGFQLHRALRTPNEEMQGALYFGSVHARRADSVAALRG